MMKVGERVCFSTGTVLFVMLSLTALFSTPIPIVNAQQVNLLPLIINQEQNKRPPTFSSPLEFLHNNTSIILNTTGSAVFNFTFNQVGSPWTKTEAWIEGPLGGLENGGSLATNKNILTRIVRFFAGASPGITWLRVSGTTQDGSKSNQYLPIRIVPYNRSQTSAYFMVSSTLGGDQQNATHSFIIKLQNRTLISQARSIIKNNESKTISGIVVFGWGGFNVDLNNNRTWSWHLAPETITFTDLNIELCDATPSHVEQHLFDWIHQVGRYCPWNWKLEREVNYQQIAQVIELDQQNPSLINSKITKKEDFTSIIVETTDDVGVIKVNMTLLFNDGKTTVLPAQPNGNGTFKIKIPISDALELTEIKITLVDTKNHEFVEKIILKSENNTTFRIIPSFSLESLVILIFVAIKKQKRKTTRFRVRST